MANIRNILITGHRGYIGSVMTPKLLKKGYKIRGIDTNYPKNLMKYNSKNFSEKIKDIRKITKNDLKDMDAVIHLAAISSDNHDSYTGSQKSVVISLRHIPTTLQNKRSAPLLAE